MRLSAVILLAGTLLQGCTWYNYDATNRDVSSHIVGRCFALRSNAVLSEHFSLYKMHMLNVAGADMCTPKVVTPTTKDDERYKSHGLSLPECVWVPVANVPRDTKFIVTNVTEQPYGGPGRCWKVQVRLLTGKSAGVTTYIPACIFDFPEPLLWLRIKSGHEYIEPLEISDRVATPCVDQKN